MRPAAKALGDAMADFARMVRETEDIIRRTTLRESFLVPRDQVFFFSDPGLDRGGKPYAATPWVHPSTMMKLKNNGRTPLWSRYTVGDREMQRDRRRRNG